MTTLPIRLPSAASILFDSLRFSPDPVFVTDRNSRIVAWNLAAERVLGYSAEAAMGASCCGLLGGCDVFGNRYCTENCPVKEMAVRGESIRNFELRLRTPDQGMVAMDVSILQVTAPPPDQYFLAHILHPARRQAPQPDEEVPAAPPRAAMSAARECADARARKLTAREVEILGLMAAGRTTVEIASLLNLSAITVRNHGQNIMEKLEVRSKAEVVAFAFQKHLV